jgi:hypothetical protein
MLRSRRESRHSDGITEPNNLQQTSATKSAKTGLVRCSIQQGHWITSANGLKTVVTWTLTPTKSDVLVRME